MSESTKSHPMHSPPFRKGTRLRETEIALVYNAGGIGDYINWTPAIRYAILSNPHIRGRVLAPDYFADLAKIWLADLSERFPVHVSGELKDEPYLERASAIIPNGAQYANACGFNLHRLGFIYYNQIDFIPRGFEYLPEIKGDEVSVERFGLPLRYAVLTPYATHANRRLSSDVYNEVREELIGRGITPVLLGKKDTAIDHTSHGGERIRLKHVIDLREKTTLPEAACIMARAEAVIGADNGLLHLAACSEVPVLWVFTTVAPSLRLTARRRGALNATVEPHESLACRFCSSRMRYVIGHDFKNCLYHDDSANICARGVEGKHLIEPLRELLEKQQERLWKLNSTSPSSAPIQSHHISNESSPESTT